MSGPVRAGLGRAVKTCVVSASVLALSLVGAAPAASPIGSITLIRGSAGRVGPTRPALSVVALGDSVTSGYACGCSAFPELYGRALAARTGATVSVDNEGVNGLTTDGLLSQLDGASTRSAVAGAATLLVTIGANDFTDHEDDVTSGACGDADGDCVADELTTMTTNLARILATISTLRDDRPTTVLVTGYWNVFQDGAVAREDYGAAGRRDAVRLTERVDAAIRGATEAADDTYVDLFAAFRAYGPGVTSLLAADGDHPDAAGHQLIAQAVEQAADQVGTSTTGSG